MKWCSPWVNEKTPCHSRTVHLNRKGHRECKLYSWTGEKTLAVDHLNLWFLNCPCSSCTDNGPPADLFISLLATAAATGLINIQLHRPGCFHHLPLRRVSWQLCFRTTARSTFNQLGYLLPLPCLLTSPIN